MLKKVKKHFLDKETFRRIAINKKTSIRVPITTSILKNINLFNKLLIKIFPPLHKKKQVLM